MFQCQRSSTPLTKSRLKRETSSMEYRRWLHSMLLNSIPEIFGEGQWRHYYLQLLACWTWKKKNEKKKSLIFICKIVFYKRESSSAGPSTRRKRFSRAAVPEQQCLQYDYIVITVICCYYQGFSSLWLELRFQTFLHSPERKNIYSEIGFCKTKIFDSPLLVVFCHNTFAMY